MSARERAHTRRGRAFVVYTVGEPIAACVAWFYMYHRVRDLVGVAAAVRLRVTLGVGVGDFAEAGETKVGE